MPTGKNHGSVASRRERGFTLVMVLAALTIVGLATQGVMTYASQQAIRDREESLLSIGQAYVTAIGAYYEASPGTLKRWPSSLDDLIEDKRFVTVVRHLREVYPDPVSHSANWGIVRSEDGGIRGVFSLAEGAPIHSGAAALDSVSLPAATRYSDWQFVYSPVPDINTKR